MNMKKGPSLNKDRHKLLSHADRFLLSNGQSNTKLNKIKC